MTSAQTSTYEPETVSPPGETLKRTLDALGLTQSELARRTGRSEKHISEIANGKASISPDMAVALERVIDVPASFWNERQRRYDEARARNADAEQLQEHVSWLDNFPIEEMVQRGFLEKAKNSIEQLRRLLDFFGVAGPSEWRDEWEHRAVAFRQHEACEASKYDTAAWLREGERQSRQMACSGYSPARFENALQTVRSATTEPLPDFCEIARREFCEAGVALVFVPELPETRVYGATRWLSSDRALIQLSFRYKRDDIFIFTLFHEAAHVLKHRKKDIFLETDDASHDEREDEANQFASEFLIPQDEYRRFLAKQNLDFLSHEQIEHFAESIGIAPSLVVGRLHHEGKVPNSYFHKLFRNVDRATID